MQEQLDALARRVDLLERRIRLQRRAAALSLMVVAGGGLAWAHGEAAGRNEEAVQEVRARRIALVGAEGRTLAALEPVPGGGARLVLFGAGDVPRIAIEVGAEGAPSVVLNDASGGRRVALAVASDDARVSVLGPGKTAVALASDGIAPRLAVSDPAGNDRVWLAVRLGSPVLQFLDPRGVARTGITTFNDDSGLAVISSTDKSRPGLVLLGRDRSVVWSAPWRRKRADFARDDLRARRVAILYDAVSFEGAAGRIQFDEHGDVRRGIAMIAVEPGSSAPAVIFKAGWERTDVGR